MPLTEEQAKAQAERLFKIRRAEKERLDLIHRYLRGRQDHPAQPQAAAQEVRRLAQRARVNMMKIVVSATAQNLYVDGYRRGREAENAEAWEIWQANRMDARQIGVHRAALAYGTAYATVLPGEPVPVIRGYPPTKCTAVYGPDDEDWPLYALVAHGNHWRLYDETNVYEFSGGQNDVSTLKLESTSEHGIGTTPVVRFVNELDLDGDHEGEIEPLMPLQDQVDLTTFSLLIAQWYGAFKQRFVIGWTDANEDKALKAAASRIWAFEDPEVQVGEFAQTDLGGYLESRESTLRHAAALSQIAAHELIGQLVNLSAEALVAAEAGQRRKVVERQMSFGESWEQVLELAGSIAGQAVDPEAEVRWRDTESRALAQTVDALGKLSQMLGVPPQELWERVPGVTQQDVERWKAAFEQSDALTSLREMLERQAAPEPEATAVA